MERIQSDAPGPGNDTAIGIVGSRTRCNYEQGNTLINKWAPATEGVRARAYARDAAGQRIPDNSRLAAERISASFLKIRVAERASRRWKEDTAARNKGKRTFQLSEPKSRPALRTEPKATFL